MAIEEPEYEILLTSGEVEVRAYKPYIVATVSVSGAAADRQAFRILANYIFGGNKTSQKMAMTAPVESRGGDYAFVMESRFSMDELPEPIREGKVQDVDAAEKALVRKPRIGDTREAPFVPAMPPPSATTRYVPGARSGSRISELPVFTSADTTYAGSDPGTPFRASASHAWVQAWHAELGWVGLDPTNDKLVDWQYVRVALGRDYGDVRPVRGVFRGSGEQTLSVAVEMTRLDR